MSNSGFGTKLKNISKNMGMVAKYCDQYKPVEYSEKFLH